MNEQNQKIFNRIFSLVLVVLMVFSVWMPATAVAAENFDEKTELLADTDEQAAEKYAEEKMKLAPKKSAMKLFSLRSYDEGFISNQYVEAYINSSGQYTMGTIEGDPTSDTDNDKLLLYGHPNPWSSKTLVVNPCITERLPISFAISTVSTDWIVSTLPTIFLTLLDCR